MPPGLFDNLLLRGAKNSEKSDKNNADTTLKDLITEFAPPYTATHPSKDNVKQILGPPFSNNNGLVENHWADWKANQSQIYDFLVALSQLNYGNNIGDAVNSKT